MPIPPEYAEESAPKMPPELVYIWNRYCDVSRGDVLTFREIDSYYKVMRLRPPTWETSVLRSIDYAYHKRPKDKDV